MARTLSGAAKRSAERPPVVAAPPSVKTAYMIAWVGEQGGIQYIQIAGDHPTSQVGHWPRPLLVFTGEGKSLEAATKRCMEQLRIAAPSWTRFIRSPVPNRSKGTPSFMMPSVVPKPK